MALSVQQIEKLKALAKGSALSRAVFESIATRDRPRTVTDLRRLRQAICHSVPIDTAEYRGLFRALQDMGLGRLILGKKENEPDRFVWSVNLIEVGVAASGIAPREKPKASVAAPFTQQANALNVTFPLRGQFVTFPLPLDGLTKEEYDMLVTFLRVYVR
jgi:hypothetical protein